MIIGNNKAKINIAPNGPRNIVIANHSKVGFNVDLYKKF